MNINEITFHQNSVYTKNTTHGDRKAIKNENTYSEYPSLRPIHERYETSKKKQTYLNNGNNENIYVRHVPTTRLLQWRLGRDMNISNIREGC